MLPSFPYGTMMILLPLWLTWWCAEHFTVQPPSVPIYTNDIHWCHIPWLFLTTIIWILLVYTSWSLPLVRPCLDSRLRAGWVCDGLLKHTPWLWSSSQSSNHNLSNSLSVPGYKTLTTDITLLPDYNILDLARWHPSIVTSPLLLSRLSLYTDYGCE